MVLGIPPFEPMSMVTPFTARDNISYLQKVNGIRDKLNELIEWSHLTYGEIIDKINTDIDTLVTQWNGELEITRQDIINQLNTPGSVAYNLIISVAAGSTDAQFAANILSGVETQAAGDARWTTPEAGNARWVLKDALSVSVKDHGAVGDGIADDTAAIATALALASAGVKRLFFPPGTYLVSGNADIFVLTTGIEIFGARATIKVKNGNGSWTNVFNSNGNDVSGLWIHDIGIDGNATNNQPTVADIVAGNFPTAKRRTAIRADHGTGVVIERCRFHDFVSTWVIVSSNAIRDMRVIGNQFTQMGKLTDIALKHDHSTVYIDGINYEIADNIFTSNVSTAATTALMSNGAISAIDTHGSGQNIHHNMIIGYVHGLQISSSPTVDNVGISVHHNTVLSSGHGLHITPYSYGMRQVDIHHNHFEIDHMTWKDHPWKNGSCGLSMNSGDTGTIKNCRIADNVVKWKETALTGMSSLGIGSVSNGIQWIRRKADHTEIDRNISFVGNLIDGAPDQGIYAQFANIDGLEVDGNTIRDAVSSANAHATYGVGLYLDYYTTCVNTRVSRNRVIDSQKTGIAPYGNDTHTLVSGYSLWAAAGNFADVAEFNTLSVADGSICKFVRENDKAVFNPPVIRTNVNYMPEWSGKAATAMVADEALFVPIELGAGAITQVGTEITTVAAGSSIEVALYRDRNGKPGDKLYSLGTIDSTLSSFRASALGNFPVAAGVYWVAFVAHGGAPVVNMATGRNSLIRGNAFSGVSAANMTAVKVSAQAVLPAVAPAASGYDAGPVFYLVGA